MSNTDQARLTVENRFHDAHGFAHSWLGDNPPEEQTRAYIDDRYDHIHSKGKHYIVISHELDVGTVTYDICKAFNEHRGVENKGNELRIEKLAIQCAISNYMHARGYRVGHVQYNRAEIHKCEGCGETHGKLELVRKEAA